MNLIINGFNDAAQVKIWDKLATKNNFKYINHISADGVSISSFKSELVIETKLFYMVGDGDYDFSDYPPLDREIMEKMLPYEPTIIKLMDRLELYSDKGYFKYQKRYSLYLKHLRYWHHIDKDKKIDLFINSVLPHEVYDYVIYALCKIYKIPVLFFFQTQMHDTTLSLSDINDWSRDIKPEYEKIRQAHESKTGDDVALTGNALKEWSLRVKNVTPFYMAASVIYPVNIFSGNKNRLKKLLNPFLVIKFIYFLLQRKIRNKTLRLVYAATAAHPDFSKKFIYVPLHLQPEMTTCPMGGAMENQELAIAMMAKYLPADVYLYIKENPKQEYFCRNLKYYQNISRHHKNIVFVPRSCDTYNLIDNSLAVATFTGTAGWEALFKQKPVIAFGDCFYDSAPGVFKIESLLDCERAIKNIVNNEFQYDAKELKLFLQAVENVSLNCCSDPAYFCISSLSVSENNDNFYNFLEKYLKEFSAARAR